MSDVPVWACEFLPAPNGPALGEATVGSPFLMKCKGDLAVAWTAEPLNIKFPKDDQAFALVVLSADQLSPQSVQLTVTGYRAGAQTPDWIRVLQGERGFEVEKPTWTIKSVLGQNARKEPYPPFGPFTFTPWGAAGQIAFWILLASLAAASVAGVVWISRRWVARRRLTEILKRHQTPLSPAHQFYRDVRALRRRLDVAAGSGDVRQLADDLARDLRVYLMREFRTPALDQTDAAIRRHVRRRFPAVDEAAGDALAKALRELARVREGVAILPEDLAQILAMSTVAVERIEGAR